MEENVWREGEEREEKSTTGRPLKNKKNKIKVPSGNNSESDSFRNRAFQI